MYFTALDIGTSRIKCLVAEVQKNGVWSIKKILQAPSAGLRKGEIVDLEEAVAALGKIFEEIKNLDKAALKNIFIGCGGANVKTRSSKGMVAVSRADSEISEDDIERAIKESQALKLLSNRMILHTIVREFIIDGVSDIRDPLGMTGARLEVDNLVIDVFAPNIKNILKAVESLGGSSAGLIYNPLAASRAVLTKNQKDLGAVLVDIGFGATTMAVYENGKLLHAAGFPVGSASITNDLAIGLKCSVPAAELIKLAFGNAQVASLSSNAAREKITAELVKKKTGVNILDLDRNFQAIFSWREMAEIIESRLTEIFEFVYNELKVIGRAGRLPAGAMICGGGVRMPGIINLAKEELKLAADFSLPNLGELEIAASLSRADEIDIEQPEWSVAIGLLLLAKDQWQKKNTFHLTAKTKLSSLKKVLNYFTP